MYYLIKADGSDYRIADKIKQGYMECPKRPHPAAIWDANMWRLPNEAEINLKKEKSIDKMLSPDMMAMIEAIAEAIGIPVTQLVTAIKDKRKAQ